MILALLIVAEQVHKQSHLFFLGGLNGEGCMPGSAHVTILIINEKHQILFYFILFYFILFYFIIFFNFFLTFILLLRQRHSMNGGGAEREGDTESETGSRL